MTGKSVHPSYDDVPYPNLSHSQSHPDRLATIAVLLGINPAPVTACRVLELGCAGGWNLIPMASSLPGSVFVGLDSAARQIDEARQSVAALALENLTFQHMDLLDVTADFGEFDYIIAHGLYSWVPPHVQEKILDICKQNLAGNGVAYVSYNTYPGWHLFEMLRRMMLYHTRNIADPHERVEHARGLIQFLSSALPADAGNGYGAFINAYAENRPNRMKSAEPAEDSFLLHDELEDINSPVYFYEFAERAERHGLQYLAEAHFPLVMPSHFRPDVVEQLRKLATSTIELEQYMDFLRSQTFRHTLLCHEDVSANRVLSPERVMGLYVASSAVRVALTPETLPPGAAQFQGPDGAVFSTDHPATIAALTYLGEIAPRIVSFDDLLAEARSRLGSESRDEEDANLLAANLLQAFCYSLELVELHVYSPPFVVEVSERPIASPPVRLQAQMNRSVTNAKHKRVELDDFSRYVLPYLDGDHDRAALVDVLVDAMKARKISLKASGADVDDPGNARDVLAGELDRLLHWLAKTALLVG